MKKLNRIKYFTVLLVAVAAFAACKKSFVERPPLSAVVDANFYKTDEQVLAAKSLVYRQVWFDYNDKAMDNLGDFRGGSAYSAWKDRGNDLFNTKGDNQETGASWRALFNVVAQ